MTFLQPFILWGLPLILVPVIIHLINRLRHRPQPWAAMMFLLQANRASTSHAKLRQLLVLLFRTLAVAALVLFVARPLAGGWLGWALSPAPDVIVILLDRSASMETRLAGQAVTRREQALRLLAQSARDFQESSHLVLVDSATRSPQRLAGPASLADLPFTAATDTAADIPAMLQAALNYLVENRAGAAEIWLASDLQRSDWHAGDDRWKSVTAQLAALPQRVRVRLLAFNTDGEQNASASLVEVLRRQRGENAELNLALDLQREGGPSGAFPLGITLDGARSTAELALDGQSLRWRHKLDLGLKKTGGWGALELPADANPRDNTAYFVYGTESRWRAAVVAADAKGALLLQASTMADAITPPSALETANWADKSLVVWTGPLPDEATSKRLKTFVEEGGAVMFFPLGRTDGSTFLGTGWGEVQNAGEEKSFRIARWDELDGPLMKTDEGLSLPVNELAVTRRQQITGERMVLASFDDGSPLLVRRAVGKGQFFFCATLPVDEWSSLGDGPVLVPMMQRVLATGARRLNQNTMIAAGELSPADRARQWVSLDTTDKPKDIATQAGVYRSGDRLLAVNRPAGESEREMLTADEAGKLFGGLTFQMLQERRSRADALQGEIWRLFLFAMLAFLLVEGALILPPKHPHQHGVGATLAKEFAKPAEAMGGAA
jgi:hypothetical protein